MSTHKPSLENAPKVNASDYRIAIVWTRWNEHITDQIATLAHLELLSLGLSKENIGEFQVPGAVELTFAASKLIETSLWDCIIVIGCVIRGDTPHFDYVCQSVTQGVTNLNADCDIPVIFGLLTVDNEQQALERTGKGKEYAQTAVEMVAFNRLTQDL